MFLKKIKKMLIIFFLSSCQTFADVLSSEELIQIETENGIIKGTLTRHLKKEECVVALIIAGSGATDRNGNNGLMQNNSLKLLSAVLFQKKISSLRYDKRGVGASSLAQMREEELRFEHYINDAFRWIEYLNKNFVNCKVAVVGHSEGSLIGMIASQYTDVDFFISISGLGQPAYQIIQKQLENQPQFVVEKANLILSSLARGIKEANVPTYLFSLFRPSIQSYLISWFKYDPAEEIKKLNFPTLILHGNTDIQVTIEQGRSLSKASNNASFVVIDGMNHILKTASIDNKQNLETYHDPRIELHPQLIIEIVNFLKRY